MRYIPIFFSSLLAFGVLCASNDDFEREKIVTFLREKAKPCVCDNRVCRALKILATVLEEQDEWSERYRYVISDDLQDRFLELMQLDFGKVKQEMLLSYLSCMENDLRVGCDMGFVRNINILIQDYARELRSLLLKKYDLKKIFSHFEALVKKKSFKRKHLDCLFDRTDKYSPLIISLDFKRQDIFIMFIGCIAQLEEQLSAVLIDASLCACLFARALRSGYLDACSVLMGRPLLSDYTLNEHGDSLVHHAIRCYAREKKQEGTLSLEREGKWNDLFVYFLEPLELESCDTAIRLIELEKKNAQGTTVLQCAQEYGIAKKIQDLSE